MPPDDAPAPRGFFDRFGAALPVALTAIATALAGLSTTEMTQAMFWRGAAAQDQSKATNQWSHAGFKRDRSLICEVAAAQFAAMPPPPMQIPVSASPGATPEERRAAEWLTGGELPPARLPAITNDRLTALLDAVRQRRPEEEVAALATKLRVGEVQPVISAAEESLDQLDRDWGPTLHAAAKLRDAGAGPTAARQAAWYALETRRYRAESGLNQQVGYLYEAQVKLLTAESERHKERSRNFFYAMLAAQMGATLASLGLARQRRSMFWSLAGAAGLVSVAFGTYVYLTF